MANKLKPCPFCGNKENLELELWVISLRLFCPSCGCHGPTGGTKQEAIGAWNRRAGGDK